MGGMWICARASEMPDEHCSGVPRRCCCPTTRAAVQVEYVMVDDTAVAGLDYVKAEGKLVFESGQKTCKVGAHIDSYCLGCCLCYCLCYCQVGLRAARRHAR